MFRSVLDRLLFGIKHTLWNTDTLADKSFILSYDGPECRVVIQDGILQTFVTGGTGADLTYDLSSYTITQLAALIAAQPGYTCVVEQYGAFASTTLVECNIGLGGSTAYFSVFTSVLYMILTPAAVRLAKAMREVNVGIRMLDVRSATGKWLDVFGYLFRVVRRTNEGDALYSARVALEKLAPRCNGVAIEDVLIRALGATSVAVYDEGAAFFRVYLTLPSDTSFTVTDVINLVKKWKAAGVGFAIGAPPASDPHYLTANTAGRTSNTVNVEAGPTLVDWVP